MTTPSTRHAITILGAGHIGFAMALLLQQAGDYDILVADRDPAPVTRVEPEYPVAAARAREEGTVLVTASIDAQGKPTAVVHRVVGSSILARVAPGFVRDGLDMD